jgi:TPR repeat protein
MKWGRRHRARNNRNSLPPDADPDAIFASAAELMKSGREDAGWELLTQLADTGHRDATVLVSLEFLSHGNYDAAEPGLRGLAAQGDAEGMYLLGSISRGRDKDEAAACRWFLGGASRADPRCMFELGTAALKDNNLQTARYWLGRAAIAGEVNAMANLAAALYGIDPDGARIWWQRAAAQGDQIAIRNLQLNPGS